ncbi:hypothetical protein PFNF135_06287 [Plasmodium falciparum NF135/5.C10]|uniref:Surface antigen n=1 Tax=Plasmodium falciparum NF135/5.C10 TaxID=1036726 RepID=W4I8H3_PLAFA|nr:hypothetical protein PFNF135_06287 [Plasmodium falciparum NF135/5.C10]
MKIHYTNILLFPLKLNILVNTHKKPSITPRHTQKIPTTRSLSECELYAPANYDNDPQMKEVMDNFNKQTQQRFHEYDDRMKTTRQKCKEQCDKEIQKIILKDKLEKQMAQQFSALHTDIHSDAIPTCICEKSIADKVEKTCLKCTQNLGGIVAPSSGVLAGIAEGALYAWKPTALDAAIEAAIAKSAAKITAVAEAARILAGKEAVIAELQGFGVFNLDGHALETFFTATPYKNVGRIAQAVYEQHFKTCAYDSSGKVVYLYGDANRHIPICKSVWNQTQAVSTTNQGISFTDGIRTAVQNIFTKADGSANAAAEIARESATNAIEVQQTNVINAIFMSKQTAIIASVVAILIIVLIMLIIYLILRYRRKKKMKKKAQYTKLLNE